MKYETNLSHSMNVLDKYKNNTVEENQAIAKFLTKNFAVATFNLKGDLNLGSIIRTSLLTGAKDFFILAHRKWDRRSAVGNHNYLNVEQHDECVDWKTTEELLVSRNYIPVVVEQGGKPLAEFMNFYKPASRFKFWNRKILSNYSPCFIFGPEEGFPDGWPAHLELEQTSVGRSYNVSSAASVILYNWSFGK